MSMPPAGETIEDSLVPLSALQHYLFCPRQCALIHVEQIWLDDGATAEGQLLHERVDEGKPDRRQGIRTVRALSIRSLSLGVIGKADAVEFHGTGVDRRITPVEYKQGRPKTHRADEVQLCAQALCLEEMFGQPVLEGALFYAQTRRRTAVAFDDELRSLTARVATEARSMILAGHTPAPVEFPGCKRCSLLDACQPHRLQQRPSIARWLESQIEG